MRQPGVVLQLLLLLQLLLATRPQGARGAAPHAPAKAAAALQYRALFDPTPCSEHWDCGPQQYCGGAAPARPGACAPCWRCCLFPNLAGSCPER